MKRMRRLEVEWVDSHSHDGWQSVVAARREHRKTRRIVSVGLLVKRDARALTLAVSAGPWGQVHGVLHIPKGAIMKVRRLR
jgi:hypothetical protein